MNLTPTDERFAFFEENYLPAFQYIDQGIIKYLGDKQNRQCRFCKKESPEVSFRNVAHAIPEFTGNKTLFSYYECDACNAKFSTLLESHMANYMNLWHTFSQVKGKRGVPSFRTVNQKKSRVDIGSEQMNVQDHAGDEFAFIDEEAKTITFKANRASYFPIAFYKCLVKMALTVMPESEIVHFSNTIEWINEPDHNDSPFKINPLLVYYAYAPGIQPFGWPSCGLFKRRINHKEIVPYMFFVLNYGNFSFQMHIPVCSMDDQFRGTPMKVAEMPTYLELNNEAGILARKKLDLSSTTLVKGEVETVVMGFEKLTEIGPDEVSTPE